MLKDLVEQITNDPAIIEKWKSLVAKDLKAFTKRTNPFRQMNVSNFYFYVDTKSFTYSIVLQGVKPNAARVRGFGAPIDKRELAPKPIHIKTEYGWRTVNTERKTSNELGVKPLDIKYYGVSKTPSKYFGLKRGGKAMAFGLSDDKAIPIYSDTGLVEWIVDDNLDELERILAEAGFKAIDGGLQ